MIKPELQAIVEQLLAASAGSREIGLDVLGEAIGSRAVSYTDVDVMIAALEAEGRTLTGSAADLRGEAHLGAVVTALRAAASEKRRRPTLQELAEQTGLSLEQVRHALMLARIMQR
jgi:hypothetical protein